MIRVYSCTERVTYFERRIRRMSAQPIFVVFAFTTIMDADIYVFAVDADLIDVDMSREQSDNVGGSRGDSPSDTGARTISTAPR